MPVCVKAIPQPDGSLVLALDPTSTNLASCPYVVESGASNAWRELSNLSVSDAQQLGLAIGLFWSIAWVFKTLGKSIPATTERE